MPQKIIMSKLSLSFLFVLLGACGSSSSNNADGGTGGAGGSAAGANGGNGGAPTSVPFMAVAPCANEDAYVAGATVAFPGTDSTYSPSCLKIAPGDTVTFQSAASTFLVHPLEPSRRRGDAANNPITTVQTATMSRAFTFSVSGFYGYYCSAHGASDDGTGMAGVIWVQ